MRLQASAFNLPSPSGTQNLIVSVPHTTATVPNVNLQASTGATIAHINQVNSYQHTAGTRANEATSVNNLLLLCVIFITKIPLQIVSTHRLSPIVSAQPTLNHQPSVLQNHHAMGRQSPVFANSQLSTSAAHIPPTSTVHVIPVSNMTPYIQGNPVNVSQAPNNSDTSASTARLDDLPSSVGTNDIKISYEKQPNNRLPQLQDESPGHRSR